MTPLPIDPIDPGPRLAFYRPLYCLWNAHSHVFVKVMSAHKDECASQVEDPLMLSPSVMASSHTLSQSLCVATLSHSPTVLITQQCFDAR